MSVYPTVNKHFAILEDQLKCYELYQKMVLHLPPKSCNRGNVLRVVL